MLKPWPDHEFFIETIDCSMYKPLIQKAIKVYSLATTRGKINLALSIKKKYCLRESLHDSLHAYGFEQYRKENNL